MANTSDFNKESSEGTIFYRRRIGDWIRRYIIELVIITLVLAFVITTTIITMGARRVFREAKDVRTAIMMAGTQYYGGDICIYDPSKPTGLAEGADEIIAALSTRKGKVFLYAWDSKESEPLKFEYHKGQYVVTYVANRYTGTTDEDGKINKLVGHWEVTYSFRVLNYDSE